MTLRPPVARSRRVTYRMVSGMGRSATIGRRSVSSFVSVHGDEGSHKSNKQQQGTDAAAETEPAEEATGKETGSVRGSHTSKPQSSVVSSTQRKIREIRLEEEELKRQQASDAEKRRLEQAIQRNKMDAEEAKFKAEQDLQRNQRKLEEDLENQSILEKNRRDLLEMRKARLAMGDELEEEDEDQQGVNDEFENLSITDWVKNVRPTAATCRPEPLAHVNIPVQDDQQNHVINLNRRPQPHATNFATPPAFNHPMPDSSYPEPHRPAQRVNNSADNFEIPPGFQPRVSDSGYPEPRPAQRESSNGYQEPLQANTRPSAASNRSLPKWRLNTFSGDPLEWPEWSGMFKATIDSCEISDTEKMSHLKLYVKGKAKDTIHGMGYEGHMYKLAWSALQRKFGQPHTIVGTQLAKVQKTPSIRIHDHQAIVDYATTIAQFVNILSSLKYSADLQSASNLQMAVSKLPPDLKTRWFTYLTTTLYETSHPGLLDFNEWLSTQSEAYERLLTSSSASGYTASQSDRTAKPRFGSSFQSTNATDTKFSGAKECPLGDGKHRIWTCEKFKKMSVEERTEECKKNRLCFKCLNGNHRVADCKGSKCKECDRKHNVLLHRTFKNNDSTTNMSAVGKGGLLQVLKVRVGTDAHNFVETFAIADTGSTATWIDKDFSQHHGLKGVPTTLNINGIHGTDTMDSELVTITVGGVRGRAMPTKIEAYVHPNLQVGAASYNVVALKRKFKNLRCFSNEEMDLNKVKILLGQNAFSLIRPVQYREGRENEPWAVKTPLGWTLSGPIDKPDDDDESAYFARSEEQELSAQVQNWWAIESYGSTVDVTSRSKEDKRAIEILESTTKHDGDRYEVGMLWSEDHADLPNNYGAAMGQFKSLEVRLNKDSHLKARYKESINKDLIKGYVRKVPVVELMKTKELRQWYLPHHPVVSPHKDKVRRVLNGAAKFKGTSLNDKLVIGPDLLNNLLGVLLRFREGKMAISADIEGMFLQVKVPTDDQRCLRFLWREETSQDVEVYQYTRHVFGAKSSPTCANYALQRTAEDNKKDYATEAVETVSKNFYMDDLLKSTNTVEDGKFLADQLRCLVQKGGFKLTKWASTDTECLKNIPPEDRLTKETLEIKDDQTVLGLKWKIAEDELVVTRGLDSAVDTKDPITQRKVLSRVSGVFDPLGLLGPYTIKARLLLKKIWGLRGQASWDTTLPTELAEEFKDWQSGLKDLKDCHIPRYHFTKAKEVISQDLHIFADASEEAMCVVAYTTATYDDDTMGVSYVMGKTRVAPMRHVTIPRLELMGAVVAVRIAKLITEQSEIRYQSTVYWTDSTTVLQWIQSEKKQNTFVANRVGEILENSSKDDWRHVPGTMNPADYGTRGFTPTQLKESVWLSGPEWLTDVQKWPEVFQSTPTQESTTEEEIITSMITVTKPVIVWKRFSQFKRLVNTVVYVKRFLRNLMKKDSPEDLVREGFEAKATIFQLIQRETFSQEAKELAKGKELHPTSKIKQYSPFIDADGLLRAKGRLQKSMDLDYNSKHPIILSSMHHAIEIFLREQHTNYHHEGIEYLRNVISSEYVILKLRSSLRAIKRKCITCTRRTAQAEIPEMADLPVERVARIFPFANTGLDYAGPFVVKVGYRKTEKRWLCLFTCLATRAVHLEVAASLDTQSCMNAISRFIARRGRPLKILSDNGTNFVGADNEFKAYADQLKKLEESMSLQEIVWKFNPPGAPHFGGVWERLVRSAKKAMYAILGPRALRDEMLNTVCCQVEQLLNGRPLTPVSSDVEDLTALTPNHFLIGRPSVNLPRCLVQENDTCSRKAFKVAECYSAQIWSRWTREYLNLLMSRSKWANDNQRQLQVGDLVWLVEERSKRGVYPLGRVLHVNMGSDEKVRSVQIKTREGVYIRPTCKCVPLPIHSYPRVEDVESSLNIKL